MPKTRKDPSKPTLNDEIGRLLLLDGYRKTYLAEHIRGLIRIYGLHGIKSDGALGLLYDILFIDNITTDHFSRFQGMWIHRYSVVPEHVEWWSVFRAFVRDCFNKTREQMNRFYRESHPDAPNDTKWFPQPAKMEPPRPDVATPPIQIAMQSKRGPPDVGADDDRAAAGNSPKSPARKRLRRTIADMLEALRGSDEELLLSDDESLLSRGSGSPHSPVRKSPQTLSRHSPTPGPSDPPLPPRSAPRSPIPTTPVPPVPPVPTVSSPSVPTGPSDTAAPKDPESRPPGGHQRELVTPPRSLQELERRRSLRNLGRK